VLAHLEAAFFLFNPCGYRGLKEAGEEVSNTAQCHCSGSSSFDEIKDVRLPTSIEAKLKTGSSGGRYEHLENYQF
jgi:hypothetical protein